MSGKRGAPFLSYCGVDRPADLSREGKGILDETGAFPFLTDQADQGAPDDDAVGQGGDGCRLRGGGDPEADGDGEGRHSLEPLHVPPDVVGPGDGRSRDAGYGDVVDKSRCPPEDLSGPLGIGRRGDERDERQSRRVRVTPEFIRLLGGGGRRRGCRPRRRRPHPPRTFPARSSGWGCSSRTGRSGCR